MTFDEWWEDKARGELKEVAEWGLARAAWTAAESRGRAQGLQEAAEACRAEQVDAESTGCPTDKAYNHACDDCADAILSLIPSPTVEKGEERCEWVAIGDGWYAPGCGGWETLPPEFPSTKCPHCSKPITIK